MTPTSTNPVIALAELQKRIANTNPQFGDAHAIEKAGEKFCIDLARRLRSARQAAGLEQAELGSLLGYSQSTISRLETGQIDMSVKMLLRVAAVLGKRLDVNFISSKPTTVAQEDFLNSAQEVVAAAQTAIEAVGENLEALRTRLHADEINMVSVDE